MTRDEATEKVRDAVPAWGSGAMLVDSLVALGLLKLDEPKRLDSRLAHALGYPECGHSHGELLAALREANLKLVER